MVLVDDRGNSFMSPERRKELEESLQIFLSTRKAQVQMWEKNHPGQRLPVFFDETKGEWWWANRKKRAHMRGDGNVPEELKDAEE